MNTKQAQNLQVGDRIWNELRNMWQTVTAVLTAYGTTPIETSHGTITARPETTYTVARKEA